MAVVSTTCAVSPRCSTQRRGLALASLLVAAAAVACGARGANGAAHAPEYETPDGGAAWPPMPQSDAETRPEDSGTDARRRGCIEGETDGGVFDVWVRREENAVFIAIPAIGVHEKWLDLSVPMRCDGDPRRATPRLTTVCSASETSFTLDLTVDDGVLVATSSWKEYGPKRSQLAMNPVGVPCGARVVFHGLTYRNPRWTRFGSPCLSKCLDRTEACAKPCTARFTGPEDELTPEGIECMRACNEAEATCMEKCPPG